MVHTQNLIKKIEKLNKYLRTPFVKKDKIQKHIEKINDEITKLGKPQKLRLLIPIIDQTNDYTNNQEYFDQRTKQKIILKYKEIIKFLEKNQTKKISSLFKTTAIAAAVAALFGVSQVGGNKTTQDIETTQIQDNSTQTERKISISPMKIIDPDHDNTTITRSKIAEMKKSLAEKTEPIQISATQKKITHEKYKNINPQFYDTQKDKMVTFLNTYQDDNEFLQELVNERLYDPKTKTLTLSKVNANLKSILEKLSLEKNIDPKIIFFIAVIESRFGKHNTSNKGASGALQAMPDTMLENCKNYYQELVSEHGLKKGQELFYNDLYIKLKAGIIEAKKTQKAYSVNLKPKSNPSPYDYIMLGANYNFGIGNFKKYSSAINNPKSEVHGYVKKLLTLVNNVKKIV